MKNKYNRNPKGSNQWELRTNNEIQKIINSYPVKWTKRDFRGEGKYNSQKILTRKETERPNLKFGHSGNSKHLEEVYKHSTLESIYKFKKGLIEEDTLRIRAKSKRQRDLTPIYKKKEHYKERHKYLSEEQLQAKRQRDREYNERGGREKLR
tara:strand:+ start:161 stop:616 length:456 start_codon:yes stop_codon:yes gene_type:complete